MRDYDDNRAGPGGRGRGRGGRGFGQGGGRGFGQGGGRGFGQGGGRGFGQGGGRGFGQGGGQGFDDLEVRPDVAGIPASPLVGQAEYRDQGPGRRRRLRRRDGTGPRCRRR